MADRKVTTASGSSLARFLACLHNQALKRKKGNNLATVELSEVLSREQLRGVMMVDTEHLLTLAVAMSKTQEKDWLDQYETIGGVSFFG